MILTAEEEAILQLRFVAKLSLRKVGTLLDMSYTRVWHIQNTALEKLALLEQAQRESQCQQKTK